jgi:transposase-like protein
VQVNITNLIDDVQGYQTVRQLRWPGGIACPSCASTQVIKRGLDETEPSRQRYACQMIGICFWSPTRITENPLHQPLASQLSTAR